MSRHAPRRLALLLAAWLAGAGAAGAEAGKYFLGAQVGLFEPTGFADSFDAVYGGSLVPLGVRFEVGGPRWFAALTAAQMEADGERVVLVPQPVGTGVATELTLRPYRFSLARRFRGAEAWRPYVGGGVTVLDWRESTSFDTVSDMAHGLHVVGGVARERGRWRWGGEAVVSRIDAGANAGLLEQFGEDDLGGVEIAVYAGWSF